MLLFTDVKWMDKTVKLLTNKEEWRVRKAKGENVVHIPERKQIWLIPQLCYMTGGEVPATVGASAGKHENAGGHARLLEHTVRTDTRVCVYLCSR